MITNNSHFSTVKQTSFQGKPIKALDEAKKIIQNPVDRQRFYRQMQQTERDFFENTQEAINNLPEVIEEDVNKIIQAIKDFFNGNGPKGPGGGGGGGGTNYEDFCRFGNRVAIPIPVPTNRR